MYDFIFKPFNLMTEEDYRTVGFKSGLEIHQQLFTEKKLFCRCPAGIYSKQYDAEILRHMRLTLSGIQFISSSLSQTINHRLLWLRPGIDPLHLKYVFPILMPISCNYFLAD